MEDLSHASPGAREHYMHLYISPGVMPISSKSQRRLAGMTHTAPAATFPHCWILGSRGTVTTTRYVEVKRITATKQLDRDIFLVTRHTYGTNAEIQTSGCRRSMMLDTLKDASRRCSKGANPHPPPLCPGLDRLTAPEYLGAACQAGQAVKRQTQRLAQFRCSRIHTYHAQHAQPSLAKVTLSAATLTWMLPCVQSRML